MTIWRIEPSYKYDLANFCNLFTEDPFYTERHRETYDGFKDRFDPAVTQPLKALLAQGTLIGPALCYALSTTDYDGPDIDQLVAALDSEQLRATFSDLESSIPALANALRHAHSFGLWEYWNSKWKPEVETKCKDFLAEVRDYPIIELTRDMLGRDGTVAGNTVTLYVSKLSAPHGISLSDASLVSDIRWPLSGQVSVATHEMMHPPFDRDDIARLADEIGCDDLLLEAKRRLPPTSGYATMAEFVEENIVEGAHIYLIEKMGLEADVLGYFVKHDYGSHVLSVLIYDALKHGLREQVDSLRELVWLMKERGDIAPGAMRTRYVGIFEAAGRTADCPYRRSE